MSWEASYLGSPSIPRISLVTWARSWLCSTMTTSLGSAHSFQYLPMVMSSLMPFASRARPRPAE